MFTRAGITALAFIGLSRFVFAPSVSAETLCREVRVAIQPDCLRPSLTAACNKPRTGSQLDLGPQIAVWVTDEQGRFVDSLMVTALTGTRGIGNRPGRWDFRSAPRFPYGRRSNVLPVWAWARGKLYDSVVMQDGQENGLGFHESASSPDPYYCRPMSLNEVDVDAITCPTAVFNSSKGKFDKTKKTPYPPRNDLVKFTDRDCDELYSKDGTNCTRSASKFAALNDLDAVSRATPPYGKPYEIRKLLPTGVTAGRYFVNVEINKEFDQNASHKYTPYQDPQLPEAGIDSNIGQPSVVFSVPVNLGPEPQYAATSALAGYGDWDGKTGTLHPGDATISDTPGSGQGRLLAFVPAWDEAVGTARVHVVTGACGPVTTPDGGADVDALPGACAVMRSPTAAVTTELLATSARITFAHAGEGEAPVAEYEIRYAEGTTLDDAGFAQGVPAPLVTPGLPGARVEFELTGLKPQTKYVLGIRAKGACQQAASLVTVPFETPPMVFTQLSGCFIATAAFGTPLKIDGLRWARDRAMAASPLANETVDAYYRSSPPLAAALATSDPARAAVRLALEPLVDLASTLRSLFTDP